MECLKLQKNQKDTITSEEIDILWISETKLNKSFPKDHFLIKGLSDPYRLDENSILKKSDNVAYYRGYTI